MRHPYALRTEFSGEPEVTEVYAERLPSDGADGDFEFACDDPDIIDMIEEERCHRNPYEGTHTYIARNHCNYCDTPAPWIRRDACRAS